MDLNVVHSLFIIVLMLEELAAQVLTGVHVDDVTKVRHADPAQIHCEFRGKDIHVDYVTWNKISEDGTRVPVYSYVQCSDENMGHNDLFGRAILDVIEPIGSNGYAPDIPAVGDSPKSKNAYITSYDSDNNAYKYSYYSDRQRPRRVGEGIATLSILEATLDDESTYECLVKARGLPPAMAQGNLVVNAVPSRPRITVNTSSMKEGDNITIRCSANTGKPAGNITWSLQRAGDLNFEQVPDNGEGFQVFLANGTTMTTSFLTLSVTGADDQAIVRCEADNPVMMSWEDRPYTTRVLEVLYPPSDGKIFFDATIGRYHCHSKAKPAPSYVWLLVEDGGNTTILSVDRYLDLQAVEGEGYFRFRCLASNVIGGQRHTKMLNTRLRVLAPPNPPLTPTTTTTVSPTLYSISPYSNHPIAYWTTAQGPPLNSFGNKNSDVPLDMDENSIPIFNPEVDFDKYFPGSDDGSVRPGSNSLYQYNKGHIHNSQSRSGSAVLTATAAPVPTTTGFVPSSPTSSVRAVLGRAAPRSGVRVAARSGIGRGAGRGGTGGVGGDYEYFDDTIIVKTPLQMGRLIQRYMAKSGRVDSKLEPLKIKRNLTESQLQKAKVYLLKKVLKAKLAKRLKEKAEAIEQGYNGKSGSSAPSAMDFSENAINNGMNYVLYDKPRTTTEETDDDKGYHLQSMSLLRHEPDPVPMEPTQIEPITVQIEPETVDVVQTSHVPEKDDVINLTYRPPTDVTPENHKQEELSAPLEVSSRLPPAPVYSEVVDAFDKLGEYGNVVDQLSRDYLSSGVQTAVFEDEPPENNLMGNYAKSYDEEESDIQEPVGMQTTEITDISQMSVIESDGQQDVSATSWREFDCRGLVDDAYGGGCRAFYRCVRGNTYIVECIGNNVFNKESGRCSSPDTAPGPCGILRDCARRQNGKYPDISRNCEFYYTCHGGKFFGHNQCNPGLIFNKYAQICDWPRNVDPPCGAKTNT